MVRKVCLGGTFNIIHDGHLALLNTAFESGDEIYIGLTSDEMASDARDVPVQKYDIRLQNLDNVLKQISCGKRFFIFPLKDPMGPAARDDFDIIVVSKDTKMGARNINEVRKNNGLKQLKIITIDMVLARDGRPISSTRILQGQIDPKGGSSNNS